jgi:hypothetical protein
LMVFLRWWGWRRRRLGFLLWRHFLLPIRSSEGNAAKSIWDWGLVQLLLIWGSAISRPDSKAAIFHWSLLLFFLLIPSDTVWPNQPSIQLVIFIVYKIINKT